MNIKHFEARYKCSLSSDELEVYYCDNSHVYIHTISKYGRAVSLNKDKLDDLIKDLEKLRTAMDFERPVSVRRKELREKRKLEAGE